MLKIPFTQRQGLCYRSYALRNTRRTSRRDISLIPPYHCSLIGLYIHLLQPWVCYVATINHIPFLMYSESRELQEVNIPPGPRLLILDHIERFGHKLRYSYIGWSNIWILFNHSMLFWVQVPQEGWYDCKACLYSFTRRSIYNVQWPNRRRIRRWITTYDLGHYLQNITHNYLYKGKPLVRKAVIWLQPFLSVWWWSVT